MGSKETQLSLRIASFIAEKKLDVYGKLSYLGAPTDKARLATPSVKPVVIHRHSTGEHRTRIDVGSGSQDIGDLMVLQAVKLEPVSGDHLPELGHVATTGQALRIALDLVTAK